AAEGFGVADGEVGDHLAVELDAGGAPARDEAAVAEAVDARGGLDAHDPEAPEVALAVAPVVGLVPQRVRQGLVCDVVGAVAPAGGPGGLGQHLAVTVAGLHAGANSGHLSVLDHSGRR